MEFIARMRTKARRHDPGSHEFISCLPGEHFIGIFPVEFTAESDTGMEFNSRIDLRGFRRRNAREGNRKLPPPPELSNVGRFVAFVGAHCLRNATTYERAAGSYAV